MGMTLDDVITEHLHWLIVNLPVIYGSVAGALLRLLMLRNEPFWVRCQNALGGIILAIVLAPLTAEYLSNGKFAVGYAMAFGLVARELILPALAVINDRIVPLFNQLIDKFLPVKPSAPSDKELDNDTH